MYLERQQDIERYQLALDLLRDVALSPKGSVRFIEKIRDTYANE